MVPAQHDLAVMLLAESCAAQWRGLPPHEPSIKLCLVRDVAEMRGVILRSVDFYFTMGNISVARIRPPEPVGNVTLDAWYGDLPRGDSMPTRPRTPPSETFHLTNGSVAAALGPVDSAQPWRKWLDRVATLSLRFDIRDQQLLESFFFPYLTDSSYWCVEVLFSRNPPGTAFVSAYGSNPSVIQRRPWAPRRGHC